MPTFRSFSAFGAELDKLNREFETSARRKIARDMGERAQRIARQEAARDLGGDAAFSGWRRNAPITLDTNLKDVKTGVVLHPTKSSAGPWTVADQGRHSTGGAGGSYGPMPIRRGGVILSTKSGTTRVRKGRARRWNGATRGKGTASDAVARFEREVAPIAERGVRLVTSKHFDVT